MTISYRRADDRIVPVLIAHGEQCLVLNPTGEFADYVAMRVQLNTLLAQIDAAAFAARNPPGK